MKVANRITNTTHLVMKCEHWEKGQQYTFFIQVKASCGYGKQGHVGGYYPKTGGELRLIFKFTKDNFISCSEGMIHSIAQSLVFRHLESRLGGGGNQA